MKKTLKIVGITLLIILLLLVAIPFAFQSQIKEMVKRFINENLNAHVEFSDVSLSFIKSFPQAYVQVDDLVITNFKPFEGDTLAISKSISFNMSVKELFKKANEDPILVNSISINEAALTFKTDSLGNTNYDIIKEDESTDSNSSSFTFNIDDYRIDNSTITYIDEQSNISLLISNLNHNGQGLFSAEKSELNTHSEALVSMRLDSTEYLTKNPIKLDALIDLDLNNSKYTFKENKGLINNLPLEFQGYVQMLDNGQDIDISFENPGSSFKDFLAVIPETYSKNLNGVETAGDFKVKGILKGLYSETTIPTIDISILSNNASFKYPDLPKKVENITINTSIKNTTGNIDDTYIEIKALNFKIDNDVFKSSATIKDLTKNMLVDAKIDGTLNLANIAKAYPIQLDTPLSGILKANVNTAFDMNAIETSAYERIKNSGNASLSGFVYASKEMKNAIDISNAKITFNPETVTLNTFEAKSGQSDINATGTLRNLIGFLLNKNKLQGNFNVTSNNLLLNDFMAEEVSNSSESQQKNKKEAFKIPGFLDCTITANAKTVVYDNLNLKDIKGSLTVKDEQASINGLTTNLFGGVLALTGQVSTKTDTPMFNLSLGADSFDIAKSFEELDLLKSLAPIAKVLEGKLNSTINLSGTLNDKLLPNLNSISGSALADLLATGITKENSAVLNNLDGALNFIDFNDLNLKDLKIQLDFSDGKVNVKPFKLSYKDINIGISGSHGFDKSIDYNLIFDVPSKYLGNEVNTLINKINDNNVKNISIPVTAKISGTFSSPQVATDLKSGMANLTKQLLEIQKQKLLNSGSDKIKELLEGIGGTPKNETTKKDSTNVQIDSVKVDTTKAKTLIPVEQGVKDILGGLIKNRKTKKDTINQKQ